MAAVAVTQPRVRARRMRLAVEREMTHIARGPRRRPPAASPRATATSTIGAAAGPRTHAPPGHRRP